MVLNLHQAYCIFTCSIAELKFLAHIHSLWDCCSLLNVEIWLFFVQNLVIELTLFLFNSIFSKFKTRVCAVQFSEDFAFVLIRKHFPSQWFNDIVFSSAYDYAKSVVIRTYQPKIDKYLERQNHSNKER